MSYDFSKIKKQAQETKEWFKNEISLLRTGRATPALVENVKVDYYGAKNPIKGMASITVEDARTLKLNPWDKEAISQIEQAIRSSDLGIQPVTEKDVIRLIFPELTEERRISLIKVLSDKMEEAKISLRRERDEVWRDIQDKEKNKEIGEDDKFRFKDELQKIVDDSNKKLDEMAVIKEKEIKG